MKRAVARSLTLALSALLCVATAACGDSPTSGTDAAPDAAPADAAADASFEDRGSEASADTGFDTGTDPGMPDVGTDAADAGPDAGIPDRGADAEPDAGGPFMAIAPCLTAAAYVTTPRVVSTGANVYEPACLRVPAGASVQLEASTVHPIDGRAGGSPGNPISYQVTTSMVTFPTPGFYPFLCPEHVDQGMIGVIWVTP